MATSATDQHADNPRTVDHQPTHRRWVAAVLLLLSCLLNAYVVQHNLKSGMLAGPAKYDDSSFMLDAAQRWQAIQTAPGEPVVRSLAHSYLARPIASFYTTPVGLAGYLIFGYHDWAPYALHFLALFALLWLTTSVAGARSPGMAALIALPIVLIPLGTRFLSEFRPDGVAAVGMIAGVWLAMRSPRHARGDTPAEIVVSNGRAMAIGACAAVAALAKPHATPAVIVFFALSLGLLWLRVLIEMRLPRDVKSPTQIDAPEPSPTSLFRLGLLAARRAILPALLASLAFVLLCLPHWYFNGRNIYNYIELNMFGARLDTWLKQSRGATGWLYYFSGEGGRQYLGPAAVGVLALASLAFVLMLVRREGRTLFEFVGLLLTALVALVIVTAASFKHPAFGMPFYVAWAAVGVRALAIVADEARRLMPRSSWRTFALGAVPALCSLAALSAWTPPPTLGHRHDPRVATIRRVFDEVTSAIAEACPDRRGLCLVAFSGPVNATNLNLWAIGEGWGTSTVPPRQSAGDEATTPREQERASFPMVTHFTDLAQFDPLLTKARVVIVGPPDSTLQGRRPCR